jgi:hypothetical protein
MTVYTSPITVILTVLLFASFLTLIFVLCDKYNSETKERRKILDEEVHKLKLKTRRTKT